ncbi:bifunctional UDP-sugar hydrolase/5'-nucleotidase [Streptomyces sp. JJ36]|uniref:bifunctional metallophosphatase/5'-nucleotidase n=1 Tax=Streptomyces sp. JJ36 TaxID=2736645 RepID=UPI001F256F9E|nr:bifunctional metallophosphatase/5'-nucleotidase [Streptomyces sp. JJ36]MCF6523692.1 bifunctional metallophosphatase/5'-nucleotidase [Streptomyces sp. JJ36]
MPLPDRPLRRLARTAGGAVLAGTAVLATTTAAPGSGPAAAPEPLRVQLLALSDLHGNLDPVSGAAGAVSVAGGSGRPVKVQAGGLPQMATLMDRARRGQEDSLTVGAGDLIGGSPLVSAAFHDEPTVEALETLGLDVTSVGHHEFDEGRAELRRMAHGGCHPEDGCAVPGERYDGADFPYLAANVTAQGGTGEPVLPPYWTTRLSNGERLGFIGLASRDTPSAVSAAGVRGLAFADEVQTIDRYARELDRQGVEAVVVLVHEGGARAGAAYDADCDAEGPGSALSGRIKRIAERATPKVDLIVSGHSHEPFVCEVTDPAGRQRTVTQAASFGRTFTEVRFAVDPESGDVVRSSVSARNRIVHTDTPEQPAVRRVVEKWRDRSAELADRPVGHIAGDLPGPGASGPETPLGDLIADARVAATRGQGARIALLDPGGMRADLTYTAQGKEGDGVVTYGEAFQVQPFGNRLVTMTLTGDQLLTALRQQVSGPNTAEPVFLQPSAGLRYTVDLSRKGPDRVRAGTVRVAGEPLRPARRYRVTVNSFLADGGDGFRVFRAGADRQTGTTDLAAFTHHLSEHSSPGRPLATPRADRVSFR